MFRKILAVFVLFFVMLFSAALPAAATGDDIPSVNGQVCPALSTGHIPVKGELTTVTHHAPEGMAIVSYCVKAGSINQGYGPEEVPVELATSVTISHSSGKAISHYSVQYATPVKPDQPDLPEMIGALEVIPEFIDVCGLEDDLALVPSDTEKYTVHEEWDGAMVTVTFQPIGDNFFAQDVQTVWPWTFNEDPCETTLPIEPPVDVEEPQVPVVDPPVVTPPVNNTPEVPVVVPPVTNTPAAPKTDQPKAPVSVDVCENLKEMQHVVPAGMIKDASSDGVVPASAAPPVSPVLSDQPASNRGMNVQTAASSAQPATSELPSSLAGVMSVLALVIAAACFATRRKTEIS